MPHNLLFLCTGNYYRSRFAEMLFNARAAQAALDWQADSRGIAAVGSGSNLGAISPDTVAALEARGIALDRPLRFPLQMQAQDLEEADLIIALNEVEHRPHLEALYPMLKKKIEYWQIPDLDVIPASAALPEIERRMEELLQRLTP